MHDGAAGASYGALWAFAPVGNGKVSHRAATRTRRPFAGNRDNHRDGFCVLYRRVTDSLVAASCVRCSAASSSSSSSSSSSLQLLQSRMSFILPAKRNSRRVLFTCASSHPSLEGTEESTKRSRDSLNAESSKLVSRSRDDSDPSSVSSFNASEVLVNAESVVELDSAPRKVESVDALQAPSRANFAAVKDGGSSGSALRNSSSILSVREKDEPDESSRVVEDALEVSATTSPESLPPVMRVPRVSSASEELQQSWAKKGKLSAWRRSLEIWLFFVRFLLKELGLRKKSKEVRAQSRVELAGRLKNGLIALGPTFIKLGQLLSTRVDVVPKEYIDQLCELQDRVPGFSGERAKIIISEELEAPVEMLYDSFDTEPIAAASLGQVHRAVYNGRDVVVKVQREGLRELFDMDLGNLKLLAVLLDKLDPKTDGADRDWVGIYDESAKLLYDEIDYELESMNAKRFADNFTNVSWIKVPEVFAEMSSRRVLTLEYCPGVKVNDIEGIRDLGLDPSMLAQRSGESYLSQLLRYGYFHCDPHAGNIAVDAGCKGGRLIYYDFGMMAEIKPEVKRGLVELIFGVYDGSSREVCNALEKMGVLRPNVDRVSVEKIARFFLEAFREASSAPLVGPDGKAISDAERKEATKVKMNSRLSSIGTDLLSVSDDAPFKFPATFTFVFRAFTTLEGIGKALDASYDLTRIARPYLKELIDLKDGSATLSAIKAAQKRLGWRAEDIESVVKQPRRVSYVASTLRSMERGDLKLRVRVLESEQSFKRMSILMETMGAALIASVFLNAAFVLSSTSATTAVTVSAVSANVNRVTVARMAKLAWIGSLLAGLNVLKSLLQLNSLDKKLNRYNSQEG